MQRVLPPRLGLSQLILSFDQWSAQGGLVLLSGSEAVLASALRAVASLLDRLHISRTCTVHQLEALITERIARALHTYASRTLIASGFLHNFYDEDVAPREAWRIFQKAVAHLRALADAGTLVLVVCPAPAARGEPSRTIRLPDRDRLLDALIATADRVIKLVTSTTSATLSTGLSLEKSVRVRKVAKRLDHEWENYWQDSSDG